jgi:hypothetical protein
MREPDEYPRRARLGDHGLGPFQILRCSPYDSNMAVAESIPTNVWFAGGRNDQMMREDVLQYLTSTGSAQCVLFIVGESF